MSKLPQHIEERFDKEFPFAIIDWKLGPENDRDLAATDKMKQIKSFIATILEEEKVRILQERDMTISMFYRNWKRRPPADKTDFDDVIAKLSI